MTQPSARRKAAAKTSAIVTVALAVVAYMMLKPTYDRAWYKINDRACLYHFKDIGLAMQQYARDSGGALPPVFAPPGKVGWADALLPYIKQIKSAGHRPDEGQFQCPFDATPQDYTPGNPGFTDYWYNANVMRNTARGAVPIKLTQMKAPAQTVLLGDGASKTRGPGFDATYNQCGDGTSLSAARQTCKTAPTSGPATFPGPAVHFDGWPILFADGHVKSMRVGNNTQSTDIENNGATTKSLGTTSTFSMLEN